MSSGGKKILVQAPVVGIDLGLKASRVAVQRNSIVEVIANPDGNHATPSVVAFNEHEILVGDVALASLARNPTNTVVECKRMLGVAAGDLSEEAKRWKFEVGSSKDGKAAARVNYKNQDTVLTGEEICRQVIMNLKETAEAYVHENVKSCVLTAPAFFSDRQRAALVDAATSAGLQVLRVISDPMAAAIAYGLDSEQARDERIAVFSMGARQSEFAVLQSHGGVLHQIGTASDHSIGGDEVHELIMNWAMDEFKKKHKMDPRESKRSVDRFCKASEAAKRQLSQTAQVRLEVENAHEGVDFVVMLSGQKMNDLMMPLLKGISALVTAALAEAGVSADAVGKVLLVGGGCRIPSVQGRVMQAFEGAELHASLNADEVVVTGAAVQGAAMVGCRVSLDCVQKREVEIAVAPHDVCIGAGDGAATSLLIPKGTPLPCERSAALQLVDAAQTSMLIQLFEGPQGPAQQDSMVAALLLERIEVGPVSLSVHIEEDGAMSIQAKDGSGTARQTVTIGARE